MSRIFRDRADFTVFRIREILEASDDPARISRRMIAELEGVLVRVRGLAASRLADDRDRRRRLLKARIQEQSWREEAEIALSSGRENWARAALFEKQKIVDEADLLATESMPVDELIRDSEREIDRIEHLLDALKQNREPLRKRGAVIECTSGAWSPKIT